MAVGFVLVVAEPGQERALLEHLRAVPGISDVVPLFGEYDLIAKVEADDWDQLGQVILQGIRTAPGVAHTKTLAAAKL